jgi:hypothetical protein
MDSADIAHPLPILYIHNYEPSFKSVGAFSPIRLQTTVHPLPDNKSVGAFRTNQTLDGKSHEVGAGMYVGSMETVVQCIVACLSWATAPV